jgi:hypothetical protein
MSELAPELNARLTAIEAALAAAEAAHAALVSDVAALDNERAADTAAIIAEIQATEAEVLMGQQAILATLAGGVNRKAFQFNSSSQSFDVLTGLDLDTGGDNVLAPCTVLYACTPRDGTVDLVMGGNPAINNSPLVVRITSGIQRVYVGTGASAQKFGSGSASWAVGAYHWGAMTWDGADIGLVFDGSADTVSVGTRSSSTQNHTGRLYLNDNGDNDCNEIVYVRGVLTLSQINSLKALLVAGDYTGAAEVIDGYNASAGCLVGPTDQDDPTTATDGVREWVAGRQTITSGSPSLIDVPS